MSQTMSTVPLNFRENLEFKNNCTYMKYLVLLTNNLVDLKKFIFFNSFYSNKCLTVIFFKNA